MWPEKAFGISSCILPSATLQEVAADDDKDAFPPGASWNLNIRAEEFLFLRGSGNKLPIIKKGAILLYSFFGVPVTESIWLE